MPPLHSQVGTNSWGTPDPSTSSDPGFVVKSDRNLLIGADEEVDEDAGGEASDALL